MNRRVAGLALCLFAVLPAMVVLADGLSLLGTSRVEAMAAGVLASLVGAGVGLVSNRLEDRGELA